MNVCSLLNKLQEFETFIRINNPAVVGICETHADSDIPDELLCPVGYRIFRKDRNKHGGGVALLVRTNLCCSEVLISKDYDKVEMCCVDVACGGDTLRVIVYYRPPYYTLDDEHYLDLSLRCFTGILSCNSSQAIIMGDFNFPKIDWIHYATPTNYLYDKFMTFVNENGLLQFVLEPTRQDNILDLVLSNAADLISDLQVECPFSTSDHHLVKFTVNTCGLGENIADAKNADHWYYDFSCADYDSMDMYLRNVDWYYEFSFVFTVEDYWRIFVYHLNAAIEACVPKKQRHITISNNNRKLYPKYLKQMLSRKSFYWRRWRYTKDPSHKAAFKAYSVKCATAIKEYYSDLETRLVQADNIGKFYRYANGKLSKRKLISPIKDGNGNIICDGSAQANIFNKYFASVFTSDDGNTPHFSLRVDSSVNCCDVSFTPMKVLQVLKHLKSKNSSGPDGFPNILLKRLANSLCNPLAFIFQASFTSHELPANWLHAIVIPVFKKGLTSHACNYRPISLTCVCCRVMERIINLELLHYLHQHGLISSHQHGFLRKHSTCTNLLESVYDWSVALNNKCTTDIIYIDFQKAFDSVSHPKLIAKLEGYGISGDLLAWLKAFLSNRTQVVNVNNSFSDVEYVTSGVPQGSVLGPTLFLLFINDIDTILSDTTVCMKLFADDVKLYSSFGMCCSSVDLQVVCDELKKWADKWQMKIALNKCSVHRISNRDSCTTGKPVYSIGACLLDQSNETRDLGVTIDCKLNFNYHISCIAHIAHVRASLILRTFVSRDPQILTKAFITYVRPLLEYCTPVWSPHTACNLKKIESCQRWFTKRIKGLYGMDYLQRLAFLGLETLQVRRIKYDLIMCYKILNGEVLLNCNIFDLSALTCTRGHKYKLYKQQASINAYKYFFSNRVCDIWNALPNSVVEASSLNSFRRLLDQVDLSQFVVLH